MSDDNVGLTMEELLKRKAERTARNASEEKSMLDKRTSLILRKVIRMEKNIKLIMEVLGIEE